MLSTVTGESANSLNSRQQRVLRAALHKEAKLGYMSESRCETAIAIMHCVAAIGDLDALPIVERIAKWKNVAENEQAVSSRARECLRALDLVKAQGRTGEVLLRSSSDPGTQADTLLRDANEAGEVDATELVRADQLPANADAPVYEAKSY